MFISILILYLKMSKLIIGKQIFQVWIETNKILSNLITNYLVLLININ